MRKMGWKKGTRISIQVPESRKDVVQILPEASIVDALYGSYKSPEAPSVDLDSARKSFEEFSGIEVSDHTP